MIYPITANTRILSVRHTLGNFAYDFAVDYQTPSNLNYFWNFGFLALFALAMQIVTGIIVAMHYVPNSELAFASVEHIMRDVNAGYFLRYLHANGASAFFFLVYLHMSKGLFYGSYFEPRRSLWISGVLILAIMIVTAFLGYVLPWGQMSFWAATVITSLCSVIPVFGDAILHWLWGGFSVGNPTLNRFFSLHFFLPFVLLALVVIHLLLLHNWGSNNPLGISVKLDQFGFTPLFFLKDFTFLMFILIVVFFFVFFYPNYLGHPDNYIPADSLVTPNHIVPEWYFLPFYAILRSVPDKAAGTFLLVMSLLALIVFPFLTLNVIRSSYLRPVYEICVWLFLVVAILLGWVGGKPLVFPYYEMGGFLTYLYFLILLVLMPLSSHLDSSFFILDVNTLDQTNSSNKVLKQSGLTDYRIYRLQEFFKEFTNNYLSSFSYTVIWNKIRSYDADSFSRELEQLKRIFSRNGNWVLVFNWLSEKAVAVKKDLQRVDYVGVASEYYRKSYNYISNLLSSIGGSKS